MPHTRPDGSRSARGAGGVDSSTPRAWTEQEFAAFRASIDAMLREARKMGLSHWELCPVDDEEADDSQPGP